MAREPDVLDDETADADDTRERPNRDGSIHRRAYLGMVGAAAAGAATAAASGTAAAASDDYDVIEVPSGQHEVISVGSGETFENVLIDCTASNTAATIHARGSDWTIRDVGFRGDHDLRNDPPCFAITAAVDAGSTGRIENVYLGDGSSVGEDDCGVHGGKNWGRSALWASSEHAGTLELDRVHFAGWPSNAAYASGAGPSGGPVKLESCYFRGNGVNHLRLGTKGSRARDCVFVHDATGYPGGRGIWAWYRSNPSDIVLEDCHFTWETPGSMTTTAQGGTATLRDCEFAGDRPTSEFTVEGAGSNPTTEVPEGVPTSAEEAAAGGSVEGDDEPLLLNTIFFDGREKGSDEITSYEFTVSGAVAASTDDGATVDDAAEVDGNRASGEVANWLDAYRFSGRLESLSVDGEAEVRVNGVAVDPDTLLED
ncbi:hypothetical protein [Salinilacihabitans rarus]|uniref:hypothetical protein n=1 Tax=Salinilacihabitans rarus TaxID=2961596 RepID=UPI0020C8D018|nr:hypothetical protein [Salinilacihabitans rarus]